MDNNNKQKIQVALGSILKERYVVEALLSQGSFGFVTECRDLETNQAVAIKTIRERSKKAEQAQRELAILQQLGNLDGNTCGIVKCHGVFSDTNHLYMCFELLDQSLESYMNDRERQPLTLMEVKPIIHQLATALLHLKSLGIVHADLNPKHVMVVNRHERPLKVRLIDFALAFESAASPGRRVQSVCYSAPEVLLNFPVNEAIDMWTLGLITAELVTGHQLYPGNNFYDVLRLILRTQGQLPVRLLTFGKFTINYFNYQPELQKWRFKTSKEYQQHTGIPVVDLRQFKFKSLDAIEQHMEMMHGSQRGQRRFMNLLKKMLHLDPVKRIEPVEVLQHSIFRCPQLCQPQLDPRHQPENVVVETFGPDNAAEAQQHNVCQRTALQSFWSRFIEVFRVLATCSLQPPCPTYIEITFDSISQHDSEQTSLDSK